MGAREGTKYKNNYIITVTYITATETIIYIYIYIEPTTTEFRSDAPTDWAIRSWVQLALRANFVQLLQFHPLFSVIFHFGYCLRQSPRFFSSNFCWSSHECSGMSWYIWYSPLKDSFEVAIESWSEWDLNPRPLNSVQML